jgi:hypothetical protein
MHEFSTDLDENSSKNAEMVNAAQVPMAHSRAV